MNTLQNIKAFLLVCRTGSFSSAARELGVAPSVVTKRITRLEEEMGAQLFVRSTRALSLTPAGERLLPQYQRLVAELDEIIGSTAAAERGIEGHLRIKGPTTLTSMYLGPILCDFHALNPGLTMDIVLLDRSVNPLEEGFDLVFGASPASYPDVADIPLCPYRIVLCAAPAYLDAKGRPEHPTELVEHDCLTSMLMGNTWVFEQQPNPVSIEVRSKLHANDARVLREAALRGTGIAVIPEFLVVDDLAKGTLVALLEDAPIPEYWLKAIVPRIKLSKPAVHELVEYLKKRLQSMPPALSGAP
ncbi:MAG TPA: LysR family transcriptional regulator [Steroidobacteraceae bacterium]|nr:LysR family transcriptional regulator [Steroidobacteraceae bacterium]